MWKTSIFADLSAPTENKSTSSMCKHQLASLGSNQEWFEESNPQGLQGPACKRNVEEMSLPLLLHNQPFAHQLCCHVISFAQLPIFNHFNQSLLNSLLSIHYPIYYSTPALIHSHVLLFEGQSDINNELFKNSQSLL